MRKHPTWREYHYTILYYTIYYILYTIYYILYTIYYILYTIYYILYTIYYILYTIYYILYIIYHILYTIYYILYTILLQDPTTLLPLQAYCLRTLRKPVAFNPTCFKGPVFFGLYNKHNKSDMTNRSSFLGGILMMKCL